jgi:hypothetical protein
MAQYLTFSNVFQYFGQIENGQYLTLENQFGALDEHGGWSPFPIGCQY